MRVVALAALTLTAGMLLFLGLPSANAQPTVTFMFPEDGAVLAEPPQVIRMCFSSPVNVRDLDKGGDFRFSVLRPNGSGLGLRIVFQRDGFGVGVHPGLPEEPPPGEWTFEWRVTDPDTLEPVTGTIHFTVSPSGSPVPEDPPPRCSTDGSPIAPGATLTPVPGATASPTTVVSEDETDGDQDITLVALITTGSILGAAAVGLVLYLVRRRIGFWMHRPPEQGGDEGGEQR